jgi:hypothetical protein
MSFFDDLPAGPVEPLTCKTTQGEPYKRSASVEREIGGMRSIPQAEWLPRLRHAQPETLVHLIRCARRQGLEVYSELFAELASRAAGMAQRWLTGVPEDQKEDAVQDLVLEIMKLAVDLEATRQTEFLEIAFIQAIELRAVDKARGIERETERRDTFIPEQLSEYEDEIEHPMEYVRDDGPDPETRLLMQELIQIAFAAIKNKKHAKAVYLHYMEGWPIYSSNPRDASLCKHFKESDWNIKYWLEKGLAAMKERLAAAGIDGTAARKLAVTGGGAGVAAAATNKGVRR